MKLIITGDFYKTNNNLSIDSNLKTKFEESNYLILNLEAPILNKNDVYISSKKSGPNLAFNKSITNTIQSLSSKTIVSCANNHMGDYGQEGVINTIKTLEKEQIKYFGVGSSSLEAMEPLILDNKIAVLSIAENEFGMATYFKAGANGLNVTSNMKQIKQLTEDGYMVIIYFHGGNEYCPIPNPFIKDLFKSFIDFGAKVVIGNHTHCPQGYENYQGGLIFYSLGNFLFDKPRVELSKKQKFKNVIKNLIGYESKGNKDFWNFGYILELNIVENKIAFELVPIVYDNHHLSILQNKEEFNAYISELSEIINNDKYESLWKSWVLSKSRFFKNIIKNYGENLSGNNSFLPFKNMISCESHLQLLKTMNEIIENDIENNIEKDAILKYINPESYGIYK